MMIRDEEDWVSEMAREMRAIEKRIADNMASKQLGEIFVELEQEKEERAA